MLKQSARACFPPAHVHIEPVLFGNPSRLSMEIHYAIPPFNWASSFSVRQAYTVNPRKTPAVIPCKMFNGRHSTESMTTIGHEDMASLGEEFFSTVAFLHASPSDF